MPAAPVRGFRDVRGACGAVAVPAFRRDSAPSVSPTPTALTARIGGRESPAEVWHRIRAGFEEKRPRLAALLAHAEIGELAAGRMNLVFRNRADADAGEKVRAEIEQAVAAGFGHVVRLVISGRDAAPAAGAGRRPLRGRRRGRGAGRPTARIGRRRRASTP